MGASTLAKILEYEVSVKNTCTTPFALAAKIADAIFQMNNGTFGPNNCNIRPPIVSCIINPVPFAAFAISNAPFPEYKTVRAPALNKLAPIAEVIAKTDKPIAPLSPHFHTPPDSSVYFSRFPHSVGLIPFHS